MNIVQIAMLKDLDDEDRVFYHGQKEVIHSQFLDCEECRMTEWRDAGPSLGCFGEDQPPY